MKTLVIEDSKSSPKLLCDRLRKMGITPIAAETGAAGIELFQKERPDLILLDIAIPDIDGYEVARRIRALERPGEWTPIIFLGMPLGDIDEGIAAGGDDYLIKPISEIVLVSKIRAMQRVIQTRRYLVVLTRQLDSANDELDRLTALDSLTGVANRRHFDAVLLREWRRAMRQGEELSILMCDIDFLKRYNQACGREAGDDCLRRIAQTLASSMDRGGDLLARYDGGEFAVVLPATSLSGAVHVAEQMCEAINQLAIAHPDAPLEHVTASFGVASAVAMPETHPRDIVDAADIALYKAKHGGRNRVCRTTSLDPQDT